MWPALGAVRDGMIFGILNIAGGILWTLDRILMMLAAVLHWFRILLVGGGGQDNLLGILMTQLLQGNELLKQLVFAEPANAAAKAALADALEQLGYRAESAPWRNIYLSGARELRGGPTWARPRALDNVRYDATGGRQGCRTPGSVRAAAPRRRAPRPGPHRGRHQRPPHRGLLAAGRLPICPKQCRR